MPYNPGSNTANHDLCADWNNQDGNVTTVGTNGGPSYYGTYDQTGNILEWNSFDAGASQSGILRGGDFGFSLTTGSSNRFITLTNFEAAFGGFRIASSSNPLSLPYFVTVGDAMNTSDSGNTNTYAKGRVDYIYQIAQYPVTNCEYAAFLNSVATTDTYSLYHNNDDARFGIIRNGTTGSYYYTVKTNMGNKPVVYVTWFDAARYCNWLHNGKPVGAQGNNTTETGAYTILYGRINSDTVAKNSDAKYYIPTENEWYKAAYYKGGGLNAGFWKYATQSDSKPACITANSVGDGPQDSNYRCNAISPPRIEPTRQVGPINIINKDCIVVFPKPKRSSTPTRTSKPTSTPTVSLSNTATPPVTLSATVTRTPTVTSTMTATPSNTQTKTPSTTPTLTTTPTVTPTNFCYYQDSFADPCCGQFFVSAVSGVWSSTNVFFNQNDRMYILSDGCASHNISLAPSSNFGPDGRSDGLLKLEGRINNSGIFSSILKLGSFYDSLAPISGILELKINDTVYTDNGGGYCVCVKKNPTDECLANNCVPPNPSATPTTTKTVTPSKTPKSTPTPTTTTTLTVSQTPTTTTSLTATPSSTQPYWSPQHIQLNDIIP